MKKNPYKYIDLFAGIGGFRLAMDNLGLKCEFSSEINKSCQDVYELNFGERPSGDITKIKLESIPNFDILVGGFPCQPFSYAGKKNGLKDPRNGHLFFEILRLLKNKERKPKMFLLENVKGIKSLEKGKTVLNILRSLTDSGYKVYDSVLNSYDFGVPQYRERWFCVGFDRNIHFEFPKGKKSGSKLSDIVEVNEKDSKLRLSDRELTLIKNHFKSKDIRVKHDWTYSKPDSKMGKYGVYSYLKPDKSLRFHVGDFAKSQIQDFYYTSLDGVAPAIIVTREPKLWDLKRRLSLLECQRLQGFPDNFKFDGVTNGVGKKQLGNAVTVTVVQEIIKCMLTAYTNNIPCLTN
jgi:DNA (cytosine-5)-methyltransferase 1